MERQLVVREEVEELLPSKEGVNFAKMDEKESLQVISTLEDRLVHSTETLIADLASY